MSNPLTRAPIDTRYPECRKGELFSTVPSPLDAELQRRLTEIGAQDIG